MNNMKIATNSSAAELVKETSIKLNQCFSEHTHVPILFLSSGGSALPLLNTINTDLLSQLVTISVLDERYSLDPTINNFAEITHTPFYQRAQERNCSFIDTRIKQNESQETVAQRFETALRDWKKSNPQGVIIATQGMGPDGHTSGIMPYPENPDYFYKTFDNTDQWIVAYDANAKNQYPQRVTTTFPFLRMIDYSIFFVTGENKKNAFQRVLSNSAPLHETPATIIQSMKNVFVFTDITV